MSSNLSQRYNKLNSIVKELWNNNDDRKAINIGIELSNEIMNIMGVPKEQLKSGDDVLDQAYPNAKFKNQKMELWYKKHPYLGNARIALNHFDSDELPVESKFYQLNESATKARISATTQLTTNWEDSALTQQPNYKVGIDFFLDSNGKSLLIVITNEGNLRVLELTERLSNTQLEIFNNLENCFVYKDTISLDKNDVKVQKLIHDKLWSALELQEVNRRFYNGVAEHFSQLYRFIKENPPINIDKDTLENEAKLFATRLLGRLHFLWFLRKKDIISKKQEYFSINDKNSTEYYEEKLKTLFFSILNTPIKDRTSDDVDTPYLNGGLFEPHDNDWIDSKVQFPETWFKSLYNHFDKFNFTTDESSPEYEQIAIDPEMLGRVFENLLATIVPETASSANERNNKGAFYTPREIVSYMNNEVLKNYLYNYLDNEKYNNGIDELIDMNDAKYLERRSTGVLDLWGNKSVEVQETLIRALDELTILDPACGSGAFPIGFLQLLVRTYDRLSAHYDEKLDKHVRATKSQPINVYNTKLSIIKNNLYGSDIEPMAVEISKLRAWLTLIIEDSGDIEPLPNLNFNFVCANSLIPLTSKEMQLSLFSNFEYEERFEELRNKYFNLHNIEDKNRLKEEFTKMYNLTISEEEGYKRINQLKSWNPFEANIPADYFDSKTMFNIESFDVLIGNPPYISLQNIREVSNTIYKPLNFETFAARGDIYTLFYEMGIKNLKKNGHLCYITSNKWMRTNYGQKLRNYLVNNTNTLQLIDLGSGVFTSATVDTNILLLKKSEYLKETKSISLTNGLRKSNFLTLINSKSISQKYQLNEPWIILNDIEKSIKEKVEMEGVPLSEWCDLKITYGVKTGYNKAYIIDKDQKEEILSNCESKQERDATKKLIKKILRGRDLQKNSFKWANLYVIFAYKDSHKILQENYPAIYAHLLKHKSELKERGQCRYVSSGKINNPSDKNYPGYPGMHHWLELDNNIKKDFLNDIEKPKILYSEIVQEPQFYLDYEGFVPEASSFMMTAPFMEYLTSILNSDITAWIFKNIYAGGGLGDTGYRYKKSYLGKLPIPIPKKDYKIKDDAEVAKLYDLTSEELNYIRNQMSDE